MTTSKILEDGKKQTIHQLSRRGDEDIGPELHIGLLFDTSGSMDADIKLSRSAAIKFLNTLSDAEDITLGRFRYRSARREHRSWTSAPGGAHPLAQADGFTAMYDALGVYLDGAGSGRPHDPGALHRWRRHAQRDRFGDVMTLVRASDVTVYSIGFLENQRRSCGRTAFG